jgi:hypothetical protein
MFWRSHSVKSASIASVQRPSIWPAVIVEADVAVERPHASDEQRRSRERQTCPHGRATA